MALLEESDWAASGRDDLVLADYFDYIGGTSTGAIIAAQSTSRSISSLAVAAWPRR